MGGRQSRRQVYASGRRRKLSGIKKTPREIAGRAAGERKKSRSGGKASSRLTEPGNNEFVIRLSYFAEGCTELFFYT